MNILIKLTCLVGLVIAPVLGGHGEMAYAEELQEGEEMVFVSEDGTRTVLGEKTAKSEVSREVQVEMSAEGDVYTAEVTITTTENGEETVETKTFTGTQEEVKAQIEAMNEGSKDAKVEVEMIEVEETEDIQQQ